MQLKQPEQNSQKNEIQKPKQREKRQQKNEGQTPK